MSVSLVLVGVALLYFGGELLVKGAIQLARILGLSPMVIGLTVVAFATSSPELAATLTASFKDASALAVGNVVGSNIANIGLILGAAALLRPLRARADFLRRTIPFMIVVCASMLPLFWDQEVSRVEGLLLIGALVIYIVYLVRRGGEGPRVEEEFEGAYGDGAWSTLKASLAVVAGLAMLVGGAQALIEGAVTIARTFAVPERVIGLTLVALGTSLPELASSLVAARRGESDIVLGNVVGSNIFNVLCILGVTATVRPMPVPEGTLGADFWVMIAFASIAIPVLHPRLRLGRWPGLLLLVLYGIYVALLF